MTLRRMKIQKEQKKKKAPIPEVAHIVYFRVNAMPASMKED